MKYKCHFKRRVVDVAPEMFTSVPCSHTAESSPAAGTPAATRVTGLAAKAKSDSSLDPSFLSELPPPAARCTAAVPGSTPAGGLPLHPVCGCLLLLKICVFEHACVSA